MDVPFRRVPVVFEGPVPNWRIKIVTWEEFIAEGGRILVDTLVAPDVVVDAELTCPLSN